MPKPKSAGSKRLEVFRTVVLAKNVGRTVASTKKMIQWGLFFEGAEHVVMLKHSVVSGKKIIFFDKTTVFESKTFSATLSHDFRIANLHAHMDVSQDSEGFLYNLIVEGINYGELPHMDRLAVSKALEAAKKAKAGKKEVKEVEVEQEEEEEEPEPEPVEEEEEEVEHKAGAKKTKKPVKKTAAKKAPAKKKVVKKIIKQEENVNVFDLDEGEDLNSFTGEQSVEDMMANLTMKIDPEMIAKYQQHQQEEKKKEENYESFDGLVDLGSGFSQKFKEAPKPKIAGASATETRKNLAKPTAALQGTTYGMAAPKIGFGGAQVDEFGNPLTPMMSQQTTNVDMAFGMGGMNGMQGGMYGGMGGMNGMQGGMYGGMGGMQGGMGGMGGMGGGMGGMNNMGGGFGQQGFNQGGFGF